MKTFVVLFAVLFAGITALPQPSEIDALRAAIIQKDARVVDGIIINLINSVKERLVTGGYDPYIVDERVESVAITSDISASGIISNLRLDGIANIAINDVSYGLLSGNLNIDLALPRVSVSADEVSGVVNIFSLGNTYNLAKVSGTAGFTNLRLEIGTRITIGIISGINLNNLRVRASMDGIDSKLSVQVIGRDYSDFTNDLINYVIPEFLFENSDQINDILLRVAEYAISQIL